MPVSIVRGWLQNEGPFGDTFSDTLHQALEIVRQTTPTFDGSVAHRIAHSGGVEPPPSIMDTPTGLTDDEGETESETESEEDEE